MTDNALPAPARDLEGRRAVVTGARWGRADVVVHVGGSHAVPDGFATLDDAWRDRCPTRPSATRRPRRY